MPAGPASTGSVVELTPTRVDELGVATSPLLWLVSLCWPACGFCMALRPTWTQLARKLKHEVVVAQWDAGVHPELPTVLGEANATPTIRALVPDAETGRPRLVDYGSGPRTVNALAGFAIGLMPNFAVRIDSAAAWAELERRAIVSRTPRLLAFLGLNASVATPPLLKALSASYRERVFIAEVRVHETTPAGAAVAARFGISSLPSVLALRAAGPTAEHQAWHHAGPPTFSRLSDFARSVLDTPVDEEAWAEAEEDLRFEVRSDGAVVAANDM